MSICKLCRKDKRLIRAHIIPESLYASLRSDSKVPRIYSNEEGIHPKRVRTGIYDSEILCAECDNTIGVWDNYAQELLLTPLAHYGEPGHLKKEEFFVIAEVQYEPLKL